MTPQEHAEKILELIDEFVSDPRPWQEKKKILLDNASEDDKASLSEFCSWFAEDER